MNRIYISGAIPGQPNIYLDKIVSEFSGDENIFIVPATNDLKTRIAELLSADVVITLPKWGDNEISQKEVSIARLMDIQVAFYTALNQILSCTQ